MAYVGQHAFHVPEAFQSLTAININAIDFGAAFLPKNQDPTRSAAVAAVAGAAPTCRNCCVPSADTRTSISNGRSSSAPIHSMQFSATRRFRDGYSFGGELHPEPERQRDDWRAAAAAAHRRRLVLRPRGSGELQRADEEPGTAAPHREGKLHVGSAGHGTATGNWAQIAAAIVNDWQMSGIFTGGSGARYDVTYQYQNNGANVNLTGSPDYAARVVINGDTGSGCSAIGSASSTPPRSRVRCPAASAWSRDATTWSVAPTRRPIWPSRATSSSAAARTVQLRMEMYNAFNSVIYNARQTQLQLVSPTNQTIRNPQFLADGTVDPNRLKTTSAGFGAVTGAQALRTIQAQLRFSF